MVKKIVIILFGILSLELSLLAIFRSSIITVKGDRLIPKSLPETYPPATKPIILPEFVTIKAGGWEQKLEQAEHQSWIAGQVATKPELKLNEREIGKFLMQVKTAVNKPAQDAVLIIENDRAIDFKPHHDGITVDLFLAKSTLADGILKRKTTIELPVLTESPRTKLSELNNLGINELVITGQTDFTGSSAARITNIRVGSSKYNGLIIKPGAEFSFTDNLGEVDAEHGFLPELVIKPEGATPEFGGGLCQVSTTAFRAAFFAGLPITARRNHSYAVHYYDWVADGQPRVPGLDATIYSGVQDMRFINDTPGAILIWTRMEGKRLYFDFYGTKDDRKVAVDGPYAFDRKATGAVKAKVTRTVTKINAEPEIVTFNSSYVPPKTLPQVTEYPKPPPAETPNESAGPPSPITPPTIPPPTAP